LIPLYLIYCVVCLVIWWCYSGYYIFLWFMSLNAVKPSEKIPADLPDVTILIPFYNESAIIKNKVKNLASLDYPKDKLDIIFLDGCSTDDTCIILSQSISEYPQMRLVKTGQSGKLNQINYILPAIKTKLIMNTDADAEIKKEGLLEIAKEFETYSNAGVVGAMVVPQDCCLEETQYWLTQNQMRVLESEAYSSSIVIAPCYVFLNGLIEKFPDDVIADDIYIAFEATLRGKKVVYSKTAIAFELRAPKTAKQLMIHKFRKTNAYFTEALRFLYHLPKLDVFWRIIYLTRVFQIILQPWFLLLFLTLTVSFISFKKYEIIAVIWAFQFFSLIATHTIIRNIEIPIYKEINAGGNIFQRIKMFVMLTSLLLIAGLAYPFYIQSGNYKKVN